MFDLSRRDFVVSSAFATALGFAPGIRLLVPSAFAQGPNAPAQTIYKYTIGSVGVTALYDGIWAKPHDPAFIRNASVAETREMLGQAELPTDFMPIPLTVIVLTINGKNILIDAGSGGQWQPTAQGVYDRMQAAGIDPKDIKTILISHFHPDHIYGLLEKDTNRPVFPDAELIVSSDEYKWWTAPERVENLPPERRPLGQRIAAAFPNWRNFTLVEGAKEVVPGVRMIPAPGHTPGHSVFLLTSGDEQLMISNDTAYVPALLAPHPEWQGTYDQDGPMAVETRRALLDLVIADKMRICGAHFPFPGTGNFSKDGKAYVFVPDTV